MVHLTEFLIFFIIDEKDLPLSETTVRRGLRKRGIVARRAVQKFFLSEEQAQARNEFAAIHEYRDESSFGFIFFSMDFSIYVIICLFNFFMFRSDGCGRVFSYRRDGTGKRGSAAR